MRIFCCFLLFAAPAVADDALITRLGGVSFAVANVERASQFYGDLLGLEKAFDLKDAGGKVQSVVFKVNDDQYLEFSPGEVESFRLDRVTLLTGDLDRVATALKKQGIATGEVAKGDDGKQAFAIRDPDRTEIRFVRYLPDSKQAQQRGKSASNKPITDHFHHVGLAADSESASMAIFKEALGMREFSRGPMPTDIRWINLSVPGSAGDLLEFMVQTAQPPAARQHIGFEVANIQQTYKQLTDRGLKQPNRPFAAAIGRWIWFIRDPNNIRVEFMGQPTEKQDAK